MSPEKVPVVAQSVVGIANALSKELGMPGTQSMGDRRIREGQVQVIGA
jgi:hypothetical protein